MYHSDLYSQEGGELLTKNCRGFQMAIMVIYMHIIVQGKWENQPEMLIHAPIHEGHNNISNKISSCHNCQEMGMVACKYIDHFVCCCECGIKDIKHPAGPPHLQPTFPTSRFLGWSSPLHYLHVCSRQIALARPTIPCFACGMCQGGSSFWCSRVYREVVQGARRYQSFGLEWFLC